MPRSGAPSPIKLFLQILPTCRNPAVRRTRFFETAGTEIVAIQLNRGGTRSEQEFRFERFRLLRGRRLLLEHGKEVRLGGRALDLLLALLERAGEIVSKEELLAYAWPHTFVEETSLRFHLSSLRKSLGDGQGEARFIANVSGRGYCFVGDVECIDNDASQLADDPRPRRSVHNLPVRLTRIIGRSDLVESIARPAAPPTLHQHHRARRHGKEHLGACRLR